MAKVMIIEDVADSANLARKILLRYGHEIRIASTGEEALQLVYSQDIDLILLDLGLPDVDGQTLLGMLRRDYGMEDVPIVVCTAWPPDSAERMAKAYGFDGFISKPFKVGEFMDIVNKYLP